MTATINIDDFHTLVERITNHLDDNGEKRVIIAVAGVPGSGKTTFTTKLVRHLQEADIAATTLPMDGYHLPRSQLTTPEMITRRGAPFTFDCDRFVQTVQELPKSYCRYNMTVPSFDHEKKDPVEDDIQIDSNAQVVVIEGNYVALSDEKWKDIGDAVTETWFIDTSLQIAGERLVKRHLQLGVSNNLEEAKERAYGSDYQNAVYILQHRRRVEVMLTGGDSSN